MKVVAYYRVSTASQGRSGLGLDAQISAVEELVRRRGMSILCHFTEVESGRRNDRLELVAALAHAKLTGAVLVIAKLDRLSRNAAFLLTLRDSGVRFIAADMPDANDLTIGVLAVLAQAEREAISCRTTEALAVIRRRLASGVPHTSQRSGRPIARLGNPNGSQALLRAGKGNRAASAAVTSQANSRAAGLAGVVQMMVAEGFSSPGKLARELNRKNMLTPRNAKWHPSSVRNLLRRLEKLDPPLT